MLKDGITTSYDSTKLQASGTCGTAQQSKLSMLLDRFKGWLGVGSAGGKAIDSTELLSQDYAMAKSFSGDDIVVSSG